MRKRSKQRKRSRPKHTSQTATGTVIQYMCFPRQSVHVQRTQIPRQLICAIAGTSITSNGYKLSTWILLSKLDKGNRDKRKYIAIRLDHLGNNVSYGDHCKSTHHSSSLTSTVSRTVLSSLHGTGYFFNVDFLM